MQINKFLKLGMAAFMAITLAACSSTDTDTDTSDQDTAGGNNTGNGGAQTSGANSGGGLSQAELEQQRMRDDALATTIFYFDFDQSELMPAAREALVYHAERLRANPGMRVRLEGHADERGTREYNLALGERRAQSVERYLQVQGVSSSQLETISYGEEMPVDNGSSEAAYSRNRRVEMVF